MWSQKISANEENFRQVSLNNERATVLPLMDTKNFKPVGKVTFLWWLSEIGTLLWKSVSKIDALVLFLSAFN